DDESADWRRIETRAFGLLATEILERCPPDVDLSSLHKLAHDCTQPDVRARPLMEEVARAV
ncbi:MAG: protein kinase, partial [Chloroflexota bacterium]